MYTLFPTHILRAMMDLYTVFESDLSFSCYNKSQRLFSTHQAVKKNVISEQQATPRVGSCISASAVICISKDLYPLCDSLAEYSYF